MSASLNPGRRVGRQFLVIQSLIVSVTCLLVGIISGYHAAFSALLGGGVSVLANGYVVFRAFRYSGARAADKIFRSFFIAEAYKVGISALGLSLLFWSQKFVAAAVFIGYIASLTAYWCFPFFPNGKAKNKNNHNR